MSARYILLSEPEKIGIEKWYSRIVFVFLFFCQGRKEEGIYILVHT